MPFQLQPLDIDNIHEHIFECYTQLASLSNEVSQDLGIHQKTNIVHVDIEPPDPTRYKREKLNCPEPYNFIIEQSLPGLYSSSNGNSTTGFVLWSTTPAFIQWLLYDPNASELRIGGSVKTIGSSIARSIPAMFSGKQSTGIVELGGGVSGILPVILGNYVDYYICTDQRGILNKMKHNIRENILQLNRRRCFSQSMGINSTEDEEELAGNAVNLEIMLLDWEKFKLKDNACYPHLYCLAQKSSTVYIVAMDVIYNDFLIDPFLKTLSQIRDYFIQKKLQTHCLIGIHLRAEDMVSDFLEKAVLEYRLPLNHVVDPFLESTRFSLYYI
ncbi:probable Ribosomal N-lysine methyltransferase 5 [Zygosaccharomyces bailii ISA1307]|nr:probable Ribosomal N-lysine methyltransferase 5 [Zygosaccharomyces bailii ISA1307]